MKERFLAQWKHGAVVTSEAMRKGLGHLKDGDFINVEVEKVYCSDPEKVEFARKLGLSE